MKESQLDELLGKYDKMDAERKKLLVKIARKFLGIQKLMDAEKSSAVRENENPAKARK